MKYFHKIKESVAINAEWIVSYRNESQIDERREILSNLGINLMRFIKLEELN